MSNKLVKNKNRVGAQSVMTSKTKEFLQKICYKKAASVDMTQHGFAADSSALLLKPKRILKEKTRDRKYERVGVRKVSVCNNVEDGRDGLITQKSITRQESTKKTKTATFERRDLQSTGERKSTE